MPKKEENKLFDLSKEDYTDLMNFAYRVAKAQEKAIDCRRIGMSVIGFDVPHVHIHLIPIQHMADMQFMKKEKCTEDDFKQIAENIAKCFE